MTALRLVLALALVAAPAAPGFLAKVRATLRGLSAPPVVHGPLSDTFDGTSLSPDWQVLNGSLVDVEVSGGALHLEPLATGASNIWFDDAEGPLVHKTVTGDFTLKARVRAVDPSAPGQPPAPQFRLGGLLVRDPANAPGSLDWVHVAFGAGSTAVPVTVEDKSTDESVSDWIPHPAPAAAGWLRIRRAGSLFHTAYRPFGAAAWIPLRTFDRPDMPATVQVGAMVYSLNAPPGIRVSFDEILVD